MFEIFDNINKMTLIFNEDKLVYANETALYFFQSYQATLIDKSLYDFFERKDADKIKKTAVLNKIVRKKLLLKNGKSYDFNLRLFEEVGREYLLIQADSKSEMSIQEKFRKVTAPKCTYDPFMLGKANIMNYELLKPYSELTYALESIKEKSDNVSEDIVNIQKMLDNFYEKSKFFINDLASSESKYNITKSVIDLDDMLVKATHRLNEYFICEDVNCEIIYESFKKTKVIICGDLKKLLNAVMGAASMLAGIAFGKKKKAIIDIKLKKDKENAYVYLSCKAIKFTKKVCNALVDSDIFVVDIDKNITDKTVMNMQLINSYIELNDGGMLFKNDDKEGACICISLPVTSARYSVCEEISNEFLDEIVKNLWFIKLIK